MKALLTLLLAAAIATPATAQTAPSEIDNHIAASRLRNGAKLGPKVRPANIKRFEILMVLSVSIGILWPLLAAPGSPMRNFFGNAVWCLFILLLARVAVRRRANWARWLLLTIFCLVTVSNIYFRDIMPLATKLLLSLITMIQALAFYFVFTGDSRRWFKPDPGVMDSQDIGVFD